MKIQVELKAPKNLFNKFGNYKYRNAEGICEAVKPYLQQYNVNLILRDSIDDVAGRVYVKATATLYDCESDSHVEAFAYAREAEMKKGMDESQITGTASSYARKYALNGLFLLDDTKDADTDEFAEQIQEVFQNSDRKRYDRTRRSSEDAARQWNLRCTSNSYTRSADRPLQSC